MPNLNHPMSFSSRPYLELMKQNLILTYANVYRRNLDMEVGIVLNQNAELMGAKIQEDADHTDNFTFFFFHVYLPKI